MMVKAIGQPTGRSIQVDGDGLLAEVGVAPAA